MNKLVSVTTRLNKEVVQYINEFSKLFQVDKSTAFRMLLQKGIKIDRKEKALELYIKGKLSLEGASKYAKMYIGDFLEMMRSKGVESNINLEDFEESLKNVKKLKFNSWSSWVASIRAITEKNSLFVKPKNFSEKDLKQGESLDDLCLIVGFEKTPPKNLLSKLPEEYQGVRVFYEEIGEIRLHWVVSEN